MVECKFKVGDIIRVIDHSLCINSPDKNDIMMFGWEGEIKKINLEKFPTMNTFNVKFFGYDEIIIVYIDEIEIATQSTLMMFMMV